MSPGFPLDWRLKEEEVIVRKQKIDDARRVIQLEIHFAKGRGGE
jgi:hypothetical protein